MRIVSAIYVQKLVKQWCRLLLDHILEESLIVSPIASFPLVCEFLEVFPNNLPGMPPYCEFEFWIELEMITYPMPILPYRMELAELTKFNF